MDSCEAAYNHAARCVAPSVWPPKRACEFAVALICLAVLIGQTPTYADAYLPPRARFRAPIGWNCATWTERAQTDLDGDGDTDRALYYDRAEPRQKCDEFDLPERWRVTLFLGGGARVDRRVPCNTSAGICQMSVADFDRRGHLEILVTTDGGAAFHETRAYRLIRGELRRIRVRPPADPRVRVPSGPLALVVAVDSGTRSGFGCRTHDSGSRVLVVYDGRPRHLGRGKWGFRQTRFRYDGVAFHVLGSHGYVSGPRPIPTPVRACRTSAGAAGASAGSHAGTAQTPWGPGPTRITRTRRCVLAS